MNLHNNFFDYEYFAIKSNEEYSYSSILLYGFQIDKYI